MSRQSPRLDLAALLATKAFSREDLAHNRRGALSPRQEAWRLEHPVFVDPESTDTQVETIVGRVVIEGRYVAARMGRTAFAKLVQPGRRLSLPAGIERRLVRDAPYRAYVAYGWVWSIEPIGEDELLAATSPIPTYRTIQDPTRSESVARELEDAFSVELAFDRGDVDANESGRFSHAQRAFGKKKLVSAALRFLGSTAIVMGFVAVLDSGVAVPAAFGFLGVVSLLLFWASSVWSLADAIPRVFHRKPLRTVARLDNDPTNPDNVVLMSGVRPLKIKRAAIAVAQVPLSALRAWRFEVFFLPWTRSVLTIRPLPPER